MRWSRLVVVAVLLAPVLVGCTRGCTAAGCDSAVTVDLSKVGSTFGKQPVDATLCVNDSCTTSTIVLTDTTVFRAVRHLLPSGSPDAERVSVTLTLARDGKVLVESKTDATLTQLAPNGLQCEPVCYSALLDLVGSALEPRPFETD